MMQNKQRTAFVFFAIAVGLCFFSSSTGSPALAYSDTGNTYGLTTEEELGKAFETEIEDYWNNYGEGGAFTGVDGIQIRYMTFVRPDEKGTIVIVSGRTESYIKYKELIYYLGKQGFSLGGWQRK
jgi:hypothetical protein